ncbi:putative toxin-antitoxin system, antitoxin component, ribbon-helix-helix domain protein [delta proteobacterium NaphS2]|nr:putative toxin-antitoxin system, antitoxin component, ribbon-helix-helix domain protein [delta proteobacterium NaphS2]
MLDSSVISYFKAKAGKRGYQTLINETLRKVINTNSIGQNRLEETLRKIIREELAASGHAR